MCEQICVLHSHYLKKTKKKKGKRVKKNKTHTIWYVIMYESVLVLFEFG